VTTFDLHIGIDYSGRETTTSRTPGLQVYAVSGDEELRAIRTPKAPEGTNWNWCRKEIAEWLIEQACQKAMFIAGIDHGFSFPLTYFWKYKLKTWEDFLADFCKHWPTDNDHTYVDFIREKAPDRTGLATDFRLTEQWTSSAKSVFLFDVQGSVAKSTHAGIPWLWRIKKEVGEKVHFWPFDGWKVPEGRSVIVEIYPSLVRNRYPKDGRTKYQQDAYAITRWLAEMDKNGFLARYFDPPLTTEQRKIADLEGWIFGVS
jgi:hypothetical protein